MTFHAADGTPLAGVLFQPGGRAVRLPVLMAGALGVPQRFYAAFCEWLAERGHAVLSFDPRGIGASLQGPLRQVRGDMLTWARQDFAAAVHQLAQRHGGTVDVVGHSLGTHHAAMSGTPTQACIRRVLSVAAGSGYWRDWAAPTRRAAPLMLHLAAPLLTPLFGHFPGRRLGMVGNLPAGVMRQWTRWCRHPDFAWGAEPAAVRPSLQSARFEVIAYSFSDDEAMTAACTQQLLDALPNAPSTLRVLHPAALGLPRIGHLGAFRRQAAAALWPLFAADLL